ALYLPAGGRSRRHAEWARESWYAHSQLKGRRSPTDWGAAGARGIRARIRTRVWTRFSAERRSKPRSSNANSADPGADAPAVDFAFPATSARQKSGHRKSPASKAGLSVKPEAPNRSALERI